jgi:cobalt transport protein ATP-binding subunit
MDHAAIEIANLSFRYPDGHLALDDISLHIAPGEKVALVGPNGSGKSTLLLHLNGVLRAQSGTVVVEGEPLTDTTIGRIRAWIGMTFQNPDDQLFSPRVRQDVAFGPLHMGLQEAEVDARVTQALAAVGLSDFADRISFHLSVGEKKRVALATVLSMAPRILVLDEPTSGLDPRARRSLIELLKTFTDKTIVVSTHDIRLAYELCSRAVVLDSGRVVADGPAERLLTDADLMERHGLETPW